jgi:hypothetical protein
VRILTTWHWICNLPWIGQSRNIFRRVQIINILIIYNKNENLVLNWYYHRNAPYITYNLRDNEVSNMDALSLCQDRKNMWKHDSCPFLRDFQKITAIIMIFINVNVVVFAIVTNVIVILYQHCAASVSSYRLSARDYFRRYFPYFSIWNLRTHHSVAKKDSIYFDLNLKHVKTFVNQSYLFIV